MRNHTGSRAFGLNDVIMFVVCAIIVLMMIVTVNALKPITEARLADCETQIEYYTGLLDIANEDELDWVNSELDTLTYRRNMLPDRHLYYMACMVMILVLTIAGMIYQSVCNAYFTAPFSAICLLLAIGVTFRTIIGCEKEDVVYLGSAILLGVFVFLLSRRFTRWNVHNHNIAPDHSKLSLVLYVLCAVFILTMLVLYIPLGIEENGAVLRIKIGGIMFQPSEFIKVALILMGALSYKNTTRIIGYYAVNIVTMGMLFYLRDLGTLIIIFCVAMAMIILLVDNVRLFGIFAAIAVILLLVAVFFMDHVSSRFEYWLHAMENPDSHQQANLLRGMIFGGLTGLGFEQSNYIINFFAIDSDMVIGGITAVFGYGMLAVVILCFMVLVLLPRFNYATSSLAFYITTQTSVLLTVQVLLNFLGSVDVLPFTGIVAPLLSEGGTALWAFSILLGLTLACLHQDLGPIKEGTDA